MINVVTKRYEVVKLETERLYLMPLKPQSIRLALEDYEKMQIEMGLSISPRALDSDDEYAMKVRLRKSLEDIENYLWLTNWAIVLKEENQIIGFIMLKGLPNEKGEVIVGYGIHESYRGRGFAVEALKGLTEWVFLNPKVYSVVADTDKWNRASHRVLEKSGAVKFNETEELIWWKINRF